MKCAAALLLACLLQACAGIPPESAPGSGATVTGAETILGRDRDFVILLAQNGDTPASIAARHLGSASLAWRIADFNGSAQLRPGQEVVVPLRQANPRGVAAQGFQTVPVLCYHRFSNVPGKLAVTPAAFDAQMKYLARNDFHVITLTQLRAFLAAGEALPKLSVVITIDDGYRSTYDIAFPILKKYGFPATVFLYTDFVGAADALTWPQMREMTASGLIEIQPHSKTHSNLALTLHNEDAAAYRERVRREVDVPTAAIEERLDARVHAFAFPYGDTNDTVGEQLARRGIGLGLTVTPGGNGFFAPLHILRRTMIYNEDDLKSFAAKLAVFTPLPAR